MRLACSKEQVGGKKRTPKQFHDAVLHEGPIPVDLIRAALTDSRPAKNAPLWKF